MKFSALREKKIKTAFDVMKAALSLWQNDPEVDKRLISRIFYDQGFKIASGYISHSAMTPGIKTTEDHCFSPCFLGYVVMDMPEIFLTDKNIFRNFSIFGATTITVTPDENNRLRDQSYKGSLKLTCSMKDKYVVEGIQLYEKGVGYVEGDFPLEVWPEVLEYEKQYLV